jgi:NAD(P)-dependent dehydrogenase (short-subunit alcohol dehydrogenase family)
MTNNVWFITGAGRGMGLDIAKAALAAGHKVVATGRNTDKVGVTTRKCHNCPVRENPNWTI